MLFAKKSNRVQPIMESDIQHFLNQGYNIVDEQNNIIHEAMPDDVISLKAAFKRHLEGIDALKEAIRDYEARMAEAVEANGKLSAENEGLKAILEQAKQTRATKASKAKNANKDAEAVTNPAEAVTNPAEAVTDTAEPVSND